MLDKLMQGTVRLCIILNTLVYTINKIIKKINLNIILYRAKQLLLLQKLQNVGQLYRTHCKVLNF